ncbi:MAG: molybdopterin-guanine dinucleotide biosynthesis protein B [Verrucomicrobia bacterium]|nr:molybdopterin-guanine dinucleotide biosynthesis protein B [Verrucomicrobiota bacterium]
MKIFGLAGWSGSGKTSLLARLLPELTRGGRRVSTIKHAHHSFDVDQPGKDSYVHRQAGAHEVMVLSQNRWALMHENRGSKEPDLAQAVARMTDVDLIVVEGFKSYPHPKLEVHRASLGKPLLYDGDDHIVAVASDGPLSTTKIPVLDLDDTGAIAAFILQHCGLATAMAEDAP